MGVRGEVGNRLGLGYSLTAVELDRRLEIAGVFCACLSPRASILIILFAISDNKLYMIPPKRSLDVTMLLPF